jgi:cytochrome c oxidase subunit III
MSNEVHITPPSWWPIVGSVALFLIATGLVNWLHNVWYGPYLLASGFVVLIYMLFGWFAEIIHENRTELKGDHQYENCLRWGMAWFIFSEVCFFGVFFGTLFYARVFILPWLAGEFESSSSTLTHILLWPSFESIWPLYHTPDPSQFLGPDEIIKPWGVPALNTLVLLTSGLTITIAHWGIVEKNHRKAVWGQLLTILLGLFFLYLQAAEYHEAYTEFNLTLSSGMYGNVFFMLTGFHGMHVTLGTIMLIVIFFRILSGHFTPKNHFAFEAVAWYWHFVDVVWLILFIFVYWL